MRRPNPTSSRAFSELQLLDGRYNLTTATLYSNLSALDRTRSITRRPGKWASAVTSAARSCRPTIRRTPRPLNGAIHHADDLDAAVACFAMAVEAMDSNADSDPVDYEVVVSNYIDLLRQRGELERLNRSTSPRPPGTGPSATAGPDAFPLSNKIPSGQRGGSLRRKSS